mmetsp:Transcript_5098/g.11156  ORF Transcript_5098/g.11156 Transcript_5098/m.11156 type:complete len:116 (+) Transcript_5098:213-560(+)
MSGLANLETYDAFADAATEEDASSTTKKQAEYVHIRIQQRNGRKSITSVSGLNQNLNLKKILKEFKVKFSTNGTIVDDKEVGKVIQLQGDQRENLFNFLVKEGVIKKDQVKVHGF